ncbi:MAG TPA: amidohydrolase family protein [Candidatus Binatia bacterium]|nr:amidohydrolase family protein [Candidatus Binatia bacterium]
MQRRRGAALLATLAVGCGGHDFVTRAPGAGRSVAVRNVRVFDARRGVVSADLRDVLVRDGRIAAVAPAGADARGLPETDGRGGVLLPGLVDVHAHTGASPAPPWHTVLPHVDENLGAWLYAGVTTVLDAGSLTPAVFRLRDELRSGRKLGPHLYAAGPMLTSPSGHPASLLRAFLPWYLRWYVISRLTRELATPADAERAVRSLLAERPDVVKIAVDETDGVPLPPAVITAIVMAAHAGGVRTVAHVGSSADALAAVRAGVDALFHEPYLEEMSDEAVAATAAAHVPVVVTLAVWDGVARLGRLAPGDLRPLERQVLAADVIAALGAAPRSAAFAELGAQREKIAAAHDARRRTVAKLRAAGVTILAGSDAANAGDAPGAGLHVEIEKLVDAGLTPGEALRTATWENARFLAGEGADFGELAPGKRADLLLVDGDPTADPTVLDRIAAVWLDGARLLRHPRPAGG